jgi:2-keto-4-pentenoate hydratase
MTTDITATAQAIAADIAAGNAFRPQDDAAVGDMARAYAIQRAVAMELINSGARTRVAGFKVAVNSAGLMQHFGVSEPAAAHVFADEVHSSPARLALSSYGSFQYEPEIAAVFDAALPVREDPYSQAEVAAAIGRFVPAFELIDTRGARIPDLTLLDAVAQNITNAGAVLGGPGVAPDALDAESLLTVVRENGETILEATGARPQPPLEAATFVVNKFDSMGIGMEAGTFILCGTHQPPRLLTAPTRIEVEMGPLGTVEMGLT